MKAVLNGNEKDAIKTSINTLNNKLKVHFGNEIKEQFLFGSMTRKTILPRKMDEKSDIDYMVVFKNNSLKPPAYLSRLKQFANSCYTRSEIYPSHPTIVLELSHIKFELVPAIESNWWFDTLQIPAPSKDFNDWMDTEPNSFNQKLVSVNSSHTSKVKPLIRLIKIWNAHNNYPFNSYELEQEIVDIVNGVSFLCSPSDLKGYFYIVFDDLTLPFSAAQWKKDKLKRAKDIIHSVKNSESFGYGFTAENDIKKLIPEV